MELERNMGEDPLGSLMVKNLPASTAYMDGFDPCPGKIPHSGKQISLLCRAHALQLLKLECLEPVFHSRRSH